MKLALCVFKYFPYGGLQRNFLAITQELMGRGHDVMVYTGSWEGDKPSGLSVELIDVQGISNHAKNNSFYTQLQAALSRTPADLVIGFNKMPGLDIYYCADTCFATKAYENKGWLYRLAPRSRWSLAFERAVFGLQSHTHILLLSASEGRAFQKYYATDEKRMHLVPPGISRSRVRHDTSATVAKAVRQSLGVADDEKLLVFLGSDYKRKGLDRMLVAIAALHDKQQSTVKALVIGRDKRQPYYQRLAQRLGIDSRVMFLGQRDDVPDLLFASDLLVHPAYVENTGNVLLEAVVAGVPVLCSGACGYAFYIQDHQLGRVIAEPFDQQLMNKALAQLLHDSKQQRRNCIEFAKTADIYSRPQRIAQIIEQLGKQQCK